MCERVSFDYSREIIHMFDLIIYTFLFTSYVKLIGNGAEVKQWTLTIIIIILHDEVENEIKNLMMLLLHGSQTTNNYNNNNNKKV